MSTAALVLAVIMAGLSSAYYDECYDDSYEDSYDDCYDGEFMTDPQSCCHYYVCDHGRPVRFVCGEGTYYSPDLQTCDHQWNVDCGTRSTEGCGKYDSGPKNDCDNDYQNGNNSCGDNNQYCSEDNNYSQSVEDDYWVCTDKGTRYNPMQMDFGPSSDVPIKNLEAYNTIIGSKTVDDSYDVDDNDYYGDRIRS